MMIHEITAQVGSHKKRKRLGRGPGSGTGKTAGRGHKGAGQRAGYSYKPGMEGGQMPFFRRFPKRGFSNAMFRKEYAVVNVKALEARFDDGAEVNAKTLKAVGLIGDDSVMVKILAEGEITKKLTVNVAAFSKSAADKITAAGGSANVVES